MTENTASLKLSEKMKRIGYMRHIMGQVESLEQERDALKEKAEQWDEFRESFRAHKCNYGIICVEKIDAVAFKEKIKKMGDYDTEELIKVLKRAEVAEAEVKALKEQNLMVQPLEQLRLQNMATLLKDVESRLAQAQDNRAIIEAAKDFGSIEWVILESALLELHKNKRVRDGVLNKFFKLRDAVLRPWASPGRRLRSDAET